MPGAIETHAAALDIEVIVHGYDTLAASQQAVRAGDIDVLAVDAERLEWRDHADEQLQAVVAGAIQLVAVRRASSRSRHRP